jgi:hypothetical protein
MRSELLLAIWMQDGYSSNYKFFFFGSFNWDDAPISIEEIMTEGASQIELKSLRKLVLGSKA